MGTLLALDAPEGEEIGGSELVADVGTSPHKENLRLAKHPVLVGERNVSNPHAAKT